MQSFHVADLLEDGTDSTEPYVEFLRESSLSAGLYRLPAGGTDPQEAHSEDEVYYVVSGEARVRVGEETRRVEPGSVVFVAKHTDHEFVDIRADLVVLVVFAPAEGTLAGE